MKALFKSKSNKAPVPAVMVRKTRDLLTFFDRSGESGVTKSVREEKKMELNNLLGDMKLVLYGDVETEPVPAACAQLTQDLMKDDTLRLLIMCLPKLNLEARKIATQIVTNLQRQPVQCRLIACDYLEKNMDLMDILIAGYEDTDLALHYGPMSRECIRHQSVARYVMQSEHMKKFFDYIQVGNFDVASDATVTFKELLTRHKSTVAEFLSNNYDWFFAEYNSKLLESDNYITRRQAVMLLGEILRSYSAVRTRYVSSRDNLRILMNRLRDSSKSIQIEAFHVFKLFTANQNKPTDICSILVTNRSKLFRLIDDFKMEISDIKLDKSEMKKDSNEQEEIKLKKLKKFEDEKAKVIEELAELEPKEQR